MARTLLVVDDEPNILASIRRLLRQDGYCIQLARSAEEGLDLLERHEVGVVVSDQRMPGMSGVEFLVHVSERFPSTVRLLFSGFADFDTVVEALNRGAISKFLTKPWDPEVLRASVRAAFEQHEAAVHHRRLDEAFARSGAALAICGGDGLIQSVNPAFTEVSGYSEAELLGRGLDRLWGGDEGGWKRVVREGLEAAGLWRGERWLLRRDGTLCPVLLTWSVVHDESGEIIRQVVQFADLTEQKERERRITAQIGRDPVTGLPNRMLFGDRLERALSAARRGGHGVALLTVGLSRFRAVNEALGRAAGDTLLGAVAGRLQECVRASDSVSHAGGDEFQILLTPVTGEEEITRVVARLRKALERPFSVAGRELSLGVGVGGVLFPDDGDTAETLIRHGDVALSRAKATGNDDWCRYAAAMDRGVVERLALEGELRGAVDRGELELFYQPQVATGSGSIVGMEALIRWRHPERGMIPPVHFIPLAEQSGLIGGIGAWTLRTACDCLSGWRRAGLPAERVGVNLSARQFAQDNLVGLVADSLRESGLPGHALELEITEGMLLEDPDRAVAVLEAFKELGVRVAVDDFGTGYSSLGYLRLFPIDTLKIDRAFVRELPDNRDDCNIVRAIVAMAHSLGHRVIAEGVETPAQREFLGGLGCDEIQGFLFSRPVDVATMGGLLERGQLG